MINNIEELKAALAAGDKIVVARGANLRGANLRGANLRGADLRWADLRWADLRGADLSKADLSKADLSWADLSKADLRWADLRKAYLSKADLSWADLSWADLSDAKLSGADLRDAKLSGADLRDAKLSGADLSAATVDNHVVCVGEESIQLLLQFCRIVTADSSALTMETVHTCDTAHCGAGWICTLSEQAKMLEGLIGWNAAACLTVPIPEFTGLFYATNQEMLDFAQSTLADNAAILRAKYLGQD
jgi:uncharacterized protein YjbI with pentapeptide repeats